VIKDKKPAKIKKNSVAVTKFLDELAKIGKQFKSSIFVAKIFAYNSEVN
jgi:hypothetical protein